MGQACQLIVIGGTLVEWAPSWKGSKDETEPFRHGSPDYS